MRRRGHDEAASLTEYAWKFRYPAYYFLPQ